MTFLEVYRFMARAERQRMDGPPRGGAKKVNDFREDQEWVTREDIEAIIGMGRAFGFWVGNVNRLFAFQNLKIELLVPIAYGC